jgi:hypothetical protein
MKKLSVLCIFAVILYFGLLTYFSAHETVLKELFAGAAAFAVLVLMLVSFVLGLAAYKRSKFRAFIPFLICVFGLPVGFVGAVAWGESIKTVNFKKNLPRYAEVVRLIEKGEIRPSFSGRQIELPEQYNDLAEWTATWTNSNGRLVEFVTDDAFPLWTASYLYVSNGDVDETYLFSHWSCYERVNTNWFYVTSHL